ncbi:MAG TPA: hypothetical protein VFW65_08675 [Pseudonocardiaceae bacterium]|nr:hypothetical protein [Pseudonocardiaceae bacterium]
MRPAGEGTPLSAEVLRQAAERPNLPPRLARAADAVLEGKFTWEDVAGGRCEHPFARSLFTPKADETLGPFLRAVAEELQPDQPVQPVQHADVPDDDDFSLHTYLE